MPTEFDTTGDTLADTAIDWLVRMRSGTVDANTRRAFEHWLQDDATHRQAYAEAEILWSGAAQALGQAHAPAGALRHRPRAGRKAWRSGLALAASVLLSVTVAWTALAPRLLGDYSTRAGEQKRVVLADGSTVLLNTDSAVALDWSSDRRRIILLKGQAEFQVAPDAARPFVVAAGDLSVRALGTVFEVYEQASGAVDVSVSEHAVAVVLKETGGEARRVEEGQRLQYAGYGPVGTAATADLHRLNAWKRGKLIFRDRPLREVVAELNRYSKARIVLQGDRVGSLHVSGVFPTDGMQVLEALEKSFSLRTLHLGPWLVILH
jgi:transmembrane sensor